MSQIARKNEKLPVYVRECECGARVTTSGLTGPSEICEQCAARLRAVVMDGAPMPAEYLFPLADANPVSCGNRADLVKKQRVHQPLYLGTDVRYTGIGFEELHVYACTVCGRDRQTRTPPADTTA